MEGGFFASSYAYRGSISVLLKVSGGFSRRSPVGLVRHRPDSPLEYFWDLNLCVCTQVILKSLLRLPLLYRNCRSPDGLRRGLQDQGTGYGKALLQKKY